MSRAALYDAIINDSALNALGIDDDSVEHNWANDERPNDLGPFIILNWGPWRGPIWGSEKERGPMDLVLWAHWPADLGTADYGKLIDILDKVDNVFRELRDVPGSDGYQLSFVKIGDRSGDLIDNGFNTITKNESYQVFSIPIE